MPATTMKSRLINCARPWCRFTHVTVHRLVVCGYDAMWTAAGWLFLVLRLLFIFLPFASCMCFVLFFFGSSFNYSLLFLLTLLPHLHSSPFFFETYSSLSSSHSCPPPLFCFWTSFLKKKVRVMRSPFCLSICSPCVCLPLATVEPISIILENLGGKSCHLMWPRSHPFNPVFTISK